MAADDGIWALIPAGGVGLRMQASLPKQYLPLLGRPVILHTIERLCAHPRVQGVFVGVSTQDLHWKKMEAGIKHFPKFSGATPAGETRAQTVLNGLKNLMQHAKPDDWVMVHDAVRPCVRPEDIEKLLLSVSGGEDGALLALPVADTVKRVDAANRVMETVNREGLWRAATPQMFRIKSLMNAIEQAMKSGKEITDEAFAMEAVGAHPRVVACHADNIKITLPGDLALAELYIKQQQENA